MSRTAAAKAVKPAAKDADRLPLVEEILRPTFRRERRALIGRVRSTRAA